MPLDEMMWHARRLKEQLDNENRAKQAEARKMRSQQAAAAARSRASRR
jgi:hypothetical protein